MNDNTNNNPLLTISLFLSAMVLVILLIAYNFGTRDSELSASTLSNVTYTIDGQELSAYPDTTPELDIADLDGSADATDAVEGSSEEGSAELSALEVEGSGDLTVTEEVQMPGITLEPVRVVMYADEDEVPTCEEEVFCSEE